LRFWEVYQLQFPELKFKRGENASAFGFPPSIDHRFVECFDVELVILFADVGCKLQHLIVFIVSFG